MMFFKFIFQILELFKKEKPTKQIPPNISINRFTLAKRKRLAQIRNSKK